MNRAPLIAALALCRRDFQVYFSYRGRALTRLIMITVSLFMFYYLSRLVSRGFETSAEYFSYVVVGLLVIEILESGVVAVLNLRTELQTGTFEQFVCSPFGAVNAIVASTIFPALLQLASALVTLCLGYLLFAMPIRWATAALAIPVALAGVAVFSSIALLGAASLLLVKQAGSFMNYATIALSILGGVYFPTSLLPGWGQAIAGVQPLTPLLGLMRHYLIGYPQDTSLLEATARIGGAIVVLTPLAYLALHYAVKWTRQRATILEF